MTKKQKNIEESRQSIELHKKLQGKMKTVSKLRLSRANLPLLYTPGVGAVSSLLSQYPEAVNEYTGRGRMIAIVSDGSAVLGLGNRGPEAALPVMEGKALLFKELGGVNAVPIVLGTQDPQEIVQCVRAIAPSFGGINLEDIASPQCFEIERALKRELRIPVMHDDQHGTAIVVLAGLINAHKVVKKSMKTSRVAIIGAGAAGIAIAKMLLLFGVGDVVVVDSVGIVESSREDMHGEKKAMAMVTNSEGRVGGILEAMAGADVVIGVSRAGVIPPDYVRVMAQKPIVFALSNPDPEITPEEARSAGASVVATGRSDYPNQINNVLAFPGVFKGALEHGVREITDDMKLRAAQALARLVSKPTEKKIIPSVFDKRVAKAIAHVIR